MKTAIEFFQSHPSLETWLVDKPLEIGLTLLAAVVIHWLARKAISKAAQVNSSFEVKLTGKSTQSSAESNAVVALNATKELRRQSRIKTLAAVARSAASIFIWVWAALSILGTLGVNVAPLIASAGVVGVALGFGAQSLVKDFLSGIFMLIEDQYGVGDTIDIGEAVGTVEDVSLRLTTLRDVHGTLWFVRNGEILRVGNFSQEFAVALINTPVSLGADTQHAIDVIAIAAKKACEDEAIKDLLLEEPIIDGVNAVKVDHMLIRTRIRTLPDKQWAVERHVSAALINALVQAGIPTPYRHYPITVSET